jgi:hypothetical protein
MTAVAATSVSSKQRRKRRQLLFKEKLFNIDLSQARTKQVTMVDQESNSLPVSPPQELEQSQPSTMTFKQPESLVSTLQQMIAQQA